MSGDFKPLARKTGHCAWGRNKAPTRPVFDLDGEYVNDQHAVWQWWGADHDHPAAELLQASSSIIAEAAATSGDASYAAFKRVTGTTLRGR